MMRFALVLGLTVKLILAGEDVQLEVKCDQGLIEFACGKEGEKMADDLRDAMTEECRNRSITVTEKYHSRHQTVCNSTEMNVGKKCELLMAIFDETKTDMGDCLPKMAE